MWQWPRVGFQWLWYLAPAGSLRPRLGHQGLPYQVPNNAAITLNWFSSRAMLGHRKLITTMILPSKIAILGPGDAVMASSWLLTIVILSPREIITITIWPSRIAILDLEWCGNDHELTFNVRHAWSPRSYHDLELAISNGNTWSGVTRQWPRIDFQWPPYLVQCRPPKHDLETAVKDRCTWSWSCWSPGKLLKEVVIHDLQGVHIIFGY